MIESYTQKIFFVDQSFLDDLKEQSLIEYKEFSQPQVDTRIIQLPVDPAQVAELIDFIPASEIKVGNVLAKTGYTDQFGPLDEFAEDHATRKYRLWVQLCIALGAKKVAINNVEDVLLESERKLDVDVGISGKAPVGSAELQAKRKTDERNNELNKKTIGLTADATGGEPDLIAAEQILRQYDLFKDDMFRSIFEMRRITSNSLVRHEFTLDFTKDMKRMFDASTKAKLSAMNKIYKGRVDVSVSSKSIEKSRTAMKLSIVVEF